MNINRYLLLVCILLPSLRGGARAAIGGEGEGLPSEGLPSKGLSELTLTLSLPQCLQLAAEHSMVLRQADLQAERARALQGTAWDIDRTNVSMSQDPTSGGSPDNAIAVSQTIEFPTVYAARHSQLKAEAKAESSRRGAVASQLNADIAAAYWLLVYQVEQRRVLAAHDSLLRRYADMARLRYEAGETRQLERLNAERMVRENAMELAAAESGMAATQAQLLTLTGTDTPFMPADNTLAPIDYRPAEGYNYAATAEGEWAYDRLVAADKALRTAKNGYAPSLSVALKNQLVITGWDPYHENRARYGGGNFMGFEVGVGIPLFYGATRARVRAARKDRELAQNEMHQMQQQRQNEYAAATARCREALSRVRYYEREGMAAADETARLGAAEYANGEITYIEYVGALQETINTRLKRAAAINDYNQAAIALMHLSGRL